MFSDLTILIAEDDRPARECVERCAHALSFKTHAVSAVREGLDELPNADIFIMDLKLVNGDATMLLERWVRDNGGPCCVISGYITDDVEADLIVTGAWNILRKPYRLEALQTTLYRYGVIVKRDKEYTEMKDRLRILARRQVFMTALAIASLFIALGKAAWPVISQLLGLI